MRHNIEYILHDMTLAELVRKIQLCEISCPQSYQMGERILIDDFEDSHGLQEVSER